MTLIEARRVRRWKSIPWFTKVVFIPIASGIPTGDKAPRFDSYRLAHVYISIMKLLQEGEKKCRAEQSL